MTNQNIPLGSISIARLSNQNHQFLNILMFPNIYSGTQKHICLITFRLCLRVGFWRGAEGKERLMER